ncbi:MAG: hypothetical protein O2819_07760 [Planctomycetota bacterium]|nr:hypothetical protein [Planctomycetota bacterium]MDA1106566.1 hypothetical protein [Planctomycetota bacterium]
MSCPEVLFADSLDFAGRYPPARMSPEATVEAHARLLVRAPWFAGRLVWPAEDLDRLSDLAEGHAPVARSPRTEGAWAVSAVTRPASSEDFRYDLEAIEEFNDRHATEGAAALCIDSLEARVDGIRDIELAIEAVPDRVFPYLEVSWEKDPRGFLAAMAGVGVGAKLRTGGLDAAAHPPAGAISGFLMACARGQVPFKATAGLHRAIRHAAPEVGCDQHGFLNLFAAAALVHARCVEESEVTSMLLETEPSAFSVDASGVRWSGRHAPVEAVASMRQDLLHSWGSCSWEEPLQDLVALGILDRGVLA